MARVNAHVGIVWTPFNSPDVKIEILFILVYEKA